MASIIYVLPDGLFSSNLHVRTFSLGSLQEDLYRRQIKSAHLSKLTGSCIQMSCILPAISALRKVCNHPDLLWNRVRKAVGDEEVSEPDVEGLEFPKDYIAAGFPSNSGETLIPIHRPSIQESVPSTRHCSYHC